MSIYRRIHDMKVRTTTANSLTIRHRPVRQVAGLGALIGLGLLLAVGHYQQSSAVRTTKLVLQAAISPVVELLSGPAGFISGATENAQDLATLYSQNRALSAENEALLKWQTVAWEMERENRELRSLLGLGARPDAGYIHATVASRMHNPLSHMLLVRFEGDARVKPGLPVVSAHGLVGHVLEVTGNRAQVLLITDRQSRIPIEHEQSGERAILAGTNNATVLQLDHVQNPSAFAVGDRIVSGGTTLFPLTISVGEVGAVHGDTVSIVPFTGDTRKLKFVSIVVPQEDSSTAPDALQRPTPAP